MISEFVGEFHSFSQLNTREFNVIEHRGHIKSDIKIVHAFRAKCDRLSVHVTFDNSVDA